MKRQSKLLLSLIHGAGLGAVAVTGSGLMSTDALAGISNTRHNLGSTNVVGGTANRVSDPAEVCVFCHPPHTSNTTAGPPPLWNKNLPNSTYTTYASGGSSTLDAAQNNGSTTTGSVSLACLSCHDGTQAIDNLINAPGSGGYNANGGGVNGAAYNWVGSGGIDANGLMTNGATNLSTDLSNDHPIGIAFCGGNSNVYVDSATTGCRDGDFRAIRVSGTGSTAQYWVDTNGGTTNREKTDMYLYTRNMGGTFKPSVECGSCHDPHVETKAANQVAFLRVSQSSSGLCLSCHSK